MNLFGWLKRSKLKREIIVNVEKLETRVAVLTRGDRHSSRVEATNPALLSSRDGYLVELTGWTKGSQAS